VDIPLETLRTRPYVIDLHALEGSIETLLDPSTSVSCGVVGTSQDEDEGSGETSGVNPPIAGIGPIDSSREWMLVAAGALCLASLTLTVTSIRQRPATRRDVAPASFHHGGGVLR
jgi:hypothetical protein